MRLRRILVPFCVVTVAGLVVALGVITLSSPSSLSASCDSLSVRPTNYRGQQPGFSYVCGQSSVSDGRLLITLNNYRFSEGSLIDWQCSSTHLNASSGCSTSGVFVLANVTIANVGGMGASVGPSFNVVMTDGNEQVGNGELGADATFPGQFPSSSMPSRSGGTYIPPGGRETYWLLFNFPTLAPGDIQNLRLRYLVLAEQDYGGTWDGSGFICPCQDVHTQLILLG